MSARRPTSRRAANGAGRVDRGRPAAQGSGRPTAPNRSSAPGRPGAPSRPAGPTRPSPASPSATAAREQHDAPRPPTITLRGIGLFVVVLVAFIVLAPTLRHAVEQQEQLRRLGADLEAAESRNRALELELEQWQDPLFVQAQARDRLGYVMPGEQTFRVMDPETVVGEEPEAEAEEGGIPGMEDAPWYLAVWESVAMAGEAVPGAEEPSEDDPRTGAHQVEIPGG